MCFMIIIKKFHEESETQPHYGNHSEMLNEEEYNEI